MEPALSRIEREYVLGHMVEEKPNLLLVCETLYHPVSSSEYEFAGDTLSFKTTQVLEANTPVRVYFSHRKRGVFFDSTVKIGLSKNVFSVSIGERIFKEKAPHRETAFPCVTLHVSGHSSILYPLEWFPLEPLFPDVAAFLERHSQIETLADKLGIRDMHMHAGRIFEYLKNITEREDPMGDGKSGKLLFLDEKSLGLLVSKQLPMEVGESFALSIDYKNRRIRTSGLIVGKISINNDASIVSLKMLGMHEEDKRFIHERVYQNRYT